MPRIPNSCLCILSFFILLPCTFDDLYDTYTPIYPDLNFIILNLDKQLQNKIVKFPVTHTKNAHDREENRTKPSIRKTLVCIINQREGEHCARESLA